MKKSILVSSALLLILSSGCQVEMETNNNETEFERVSVEASILSTRTSVDGLSPVWSEGDQVAFITEDLQVCPPFIADEEGTTTTFSGEKPSGSRLMYALYPYDPSTSYSKSGIMTTLPSVQDGSFSNAIMVAEGNETDGFIFDNVCCLIKMNVPSSLNIVRVEVFSEEQLTGGFGVYSTEKGLQVVASSPSGISEQKAVVSRNGNIVSGDIYAAILPSEAEKLNLAFINASGKVATVSKALSSGRPLSSGTMKDLGTVRNLSFGAAAPISDPTYSQL